MLELRLVYNQIGLSDVVSRKRWDLTNPNDAQQSTRKMKVMRMHITYDNVSRLIVNHRLCKVSPRNKYTKSEKRKYNE